MPYCANLDGLYTQNLSWPVQLRLDLFIIPVTNVNPQIFLSSDTVTGVYV
jgi:hypothetical protein